MRAPPLLLCQEIIEVSHSLFESTDLSRKVKNCHKNIIGIVKGTSVEMSFNAAK
jgi:hypothetical protein